jgi:spore coat polysaccharide biosynthesis protein SpsF (cytidylyltransferase family)
MINKNRGIIIQARTKSTRLPDKVIAQFYEEKSILEIILERFIKAFSDIPLIVATSTNFNDDSIETLVRKYPSVKIYRGDEDNVLKRFIDAAEYFSLNSIMRVCSDNLFVDMDMCKTLFSIGERIDADYISFELDNNLPVIKSHLGFFTELISLKALKKVNDSTSEKIYLEHVTNYIYTHHTEFKVHFVPAPELFYYIKDIRLTIDTPEDFKNVLSIYTLLARTNQIITPERIIKLIYSKKQLLNSMSTQIKLNSK